MKIAVVVTGGFHPSGREQVVPSWLTLFEALSASHDIHAFVLRHLPEPCRYTLRGVDVHDVGRPSAPFGLWRRACEQALARAAADHGPFDLVHGFWGDPAGQLAVRLARQLGVPSIATCDSGEFEDLALIAYGSQRSPRGRAAVKDALTATRVHVCSEYMSAKAAAHGADTVVIPLTTVRVATAPRARPPHAPLALIQVASLSLVKNQRLLIDAVALLDPAIVSRVDLVGEDTLDGRLQRHALEQKVASRVVFHGFKAQDQLGAIYRNADVYVQTSLHEAAGVSVLEAAAAGLPVIGTRAGYVADWAGRRAIALDVVDPEHLAAALAALHANSASAARMAARAQKWSTAHNATAMAAQFDLLYRETAARR